MVALHAIDPYDNNYGEVTTITNIRHRYNDATSRERGVIPHFEYNIDKPGNPRYMDYELVPYSEFMEYISQIE